MQAKIDIRISHVSINEHFVPCSSIELRGEMCKCEKMLSFIYRISKESNCKIIYI